MRPLLRPPWPIQTQLLRWHLRAPQSIPRRIATTSASNAAPVDIPKLILSPGSEFHNSLPSFLEYAKRRGLPAHASVYIGTHYEYTSALSLLRLGFSLLRVGRRFDDGIDLIGHWVLAPLREPLRVIIQCKARSISVSPCHVRELEGSFYAAPCDWRNKDVLGLLVTPEKATRGTLRAMAESRWPMGFVMISKEGLIQQFVWNKAAASRGLEGVGVVLRHAPRALFPGLQEPPNPNAPKVPKKLAKFNNSGTTKDIVLTWMGSPIFPDRETLDDKTLDLMRTIESDPEKVDPDPMAFKNGNPRVAVRAPIPRGGVVIPPRTRGRRKKQLDEIGGWPPNQALKKVARPKKEVEKKMGSAKKEVKKTVVRAKKDVVEKMGRPKKEVETTPVPAKKLGRPKGSKNKPRDAVDAG
jgi:hypothetical protein